MNNEQEHNNQNNMVQKSNEPEHNNQDNTAQERKAGYRGLAAILIATVLYVITFGIETPGDTAPPDPILGRVIMAVSGIIFGFLYVFVVRKCMIKNSFAKICLIILSILLFVSCAFYVSLAVGVIPPQNEEAYFDDFPEDEIIRNEIIDEVNEVNNEIINEVNEVSNEIIDEINEINEIDGEIR